MSDTTTITAEPEVKMTKGQATLRGKVVAGLSAFVQSEQGRTKVLKDLAVIVVQFRKTFTYKGAPDWGGRSDSYKRVISVVYDEAGLPQGKVGTTEGALRQQILNSLAYHVQNEVRGKAPAEDLKALGMAKDSPKDRAKTSAASSASGTTMQSWKVPEEVKVIGTQMAASVTSKDPNACVTVMISMIGQAKGYDVPEDPTALLVNLSLLRGEIEDWADAINATVTDRADQKDAHLKTAAPAA